MSAAVLPPPSSINGETRHLAPDLVPAPASGPLSDDEWPELDNGDADGNTDDTSKPAEDAPARSPSPPAAAAAREPSPVPEPRALSPVASLKSPSPPPVEPIGELEVVVVNGDATDDTVEDGMEVDATSATPAEPEVATTASETVESDEHIVEIPSITVQEDATPTADEPMLPPGLDPTAPATNGHTRPPLDESEDNEDDEAATPLLAKPSSDGEDIEMEEDQEWTDDLESGGSEVVEPTMEDRMLVRINELEEENAVLRHMDASRQHEIASLRKQLSGVTTQLTSTEQRLLTVSSDLATSRSFVSSEDADGAQLLQAFTDLLEAIDDHIYLLLDEVGDPPEDAVITLETARACADGPSLEPLREFVYASLAHGMSLQEFIALFFQALLVDVLEKSIFGPFVPGMDVQASETLYACYADVAASETQDRSARWRAITYQRVGGARNDDELAGTISDTFFTAIESCLPALLPERDPETIAGLREQFASASRKLARDALKLRDLCMKVYLSVDYVLTFPKYGARVAPATVKITDTLIRCPHSLPAEDDVKKDGVVCLAIMSPGLTASKSKPRPGGKDGEVDRTTSVLRKPGIAVAKCQWSLAHPTA